MNLCRYHATKLPVPQSHQQRAVPIEPLGDTLEPL